MSALLSEFLEVEGLQGVYSATNKNLRCLAIRLTTGGLCLFSPVSGLNPKTHKSLAAFGEVEYLLAPNYYHNKGLAEYYAAYHKAQVCAPEKAHVRLQKVTGLQFLDLQTLETALPENMGLIFTQGLKTGEVWLTVEGRQQMALIVVDAFCGPNTKSAGFAEKPEMLKPFPKFGVGDRAVYRSWAKNQIQIDKPTMLLPCHGDMVCNSDLSKDLCNLLEENLQ